MHSLLITCCPWTFPHACSPGASVSSAVSTPNHGTRYALGGSHPVTSVYVPSLNIYLGPDLVNMCTRAACALAQRPCRSLPRCSTAPAPWAWTSACRRSRRRRRTRRRRRQRQHSNDQQAAAAAAGRRGGRCRGSSGSGSGGSGTGSGSEAADTTVVAGAMDYSASKRVLGGTWGCSRNRRSRRVRHWRQRQGIHEMLAMCGQRLGGGGATCVGMRCMSCGEQEAR